MSRTRDKAAVTDSEDVAALKRQLAESNAERDQALAREVAIGELLGVINFSPGDLTPVFDAMLEKAMRLCGANFGLMHTYDGEHFHHAADHGVPAAYAKFRRDRGPTVYGSGTTPARLVAGDDLVHTVDLMATEPYEHGDPARRALVDLGGARSHLTAALRKRDILLGAISIYRQDVHPFTDTQIALVQNFAAQAVIAMENARLITETREALEQQNATAEVLGVINSSLGDLAPVFDAILEKAHSLCGASFGSLNIYDGPYQIRAVAVRGLPKSFSDRLRSGVRLSDTHPAIALATSASFVQVRDSAAIDDPMARAALSAGLRTVLFIPLRHRDQLIGHIVAARPEVRLFSEKDIAVLQNFAAQAVIAMENARLLNETRERTAELQEALEQQTATAEVLGVINSSPGDLAPVFDAMLERAMRLCETTFGHLMTWDGERFHRIAFRGMPEDLTEEMRQPIKPVPGTFIDQIVQGKDLICHVDLQEAETGSIGPGAASLMRFGARARAMVALRKDDRLLGTITVYRTEARPFTDKQIALLQNFAAQAVIAMENARLITETREALEQQTATADVLGVINSSPGKLQPVFDTMLEKATKLCEAASGHLYL